MEPDGDLANGARHFQARPLDSTTVLLARLRAGDPDALERLLARYVEPLRRWASGRLPRWARDVSDTHDLVQDALAQTLRRLDAFELDRTGALHAYLRQAVTNRVRDEVRKVGRSQKRGSAVLDELASPLPSPLEAAIGRETLARYEAALATLSPGDREAVIGRLEFGLDYEELAAALNKPTINATRVAVCRAISRTARAMRDAR